MNLDNYHLKANHDPLMFVMIRPYSYHDPELFDKFSQESSLLTVFR